MRGTLVLWSLALVVAFGLSIAANEKPTEAYSSTMKSNAATGQALRRDTMAKDYDAIAKDASTFKANFAKIEAFWTAKKVDDASGFAKAGGKAAADLETAAGAKNDEAIAAATMAMNATCGSCHMAHRERLPDMTFEIK
jgi:mono/diheme cytochrome c family protein